MICAPTDLFAKRVKEGVAHERDERSSLMYAHTYVIGMVWEWQAAQHQEEIQHRQSQLEMHVNVNKDLMDKMVGVQIENNELRVRCFRAALCFDVVKASGGTDGDWLAYTRHMAHKHTQTHNRTSASDSRSSSSCGSRSWCGSRTSSRTCPHPPPPRPSP